MLDDLLDKLKNINARMSPEQLQLYLAQLNRIQEIKQHYRELANRIREQSPTFVPSGEAIAKGGLIGVPAIIGLATLASYYKRFGKILGRLPRPLKYLGLALPFPVSLYVLYKLIAARQSS